MALIFITYLTCLICPINVGIILAVGKDRITNTGSTGRKILMNGYIINEKID